MKKLGNFELEIKTETPIEFEKVIELKRFISKIVAIPEQLKWKVHTRVADPIRIDFFWITSIPEDDIFEILNYVDKKELFHTKKIKFNEEAD